MMKTHGSTNKLAWSALLNPDFVQRTRLAVRYQAWAAKHMKDNRNPVSSEADIEFEDIHLMGFSGPSEGLHGIFRQFCRSPAMRNDERAMRYIHGLMLPEKE